MNFYYCTCYNFIAYFRFAYFRLDHCAYCSNLCCTVSAKFVLRYERFIVCRRTLPRVLLIVASVFSWPGRKIKLRRSRSLKDLRNTGFELGRSSEKNKERCLSLVYPQHFWSHCFLCSSDGTFLLSLYRIFACRDDSTFREQGRRKICSFWRGFRIQPSYILLFYLFIWIRNIKYQGNSASQSRFYSSLPQRLTQQVSGVVSPVFGG